MAKSGGGGAEAIIFELRASIDKLKKDNKAALGEIEKLTGQLKKQGVKSGNSFFDGFKSGLDKSEKALSGFGKKAAMALGPVGIAVAVITKAISGIAGAFSGALAANETYAKSVEYLKERSAKSFRAMIQPAADFFASIVIKAAEGKRATESFNDAIDAMKKGLDVKAADTFGTEYQRVTDVIKKANADIERLNQNIKDAEEQEKAAVAAGYETGAGQNAALKKQLEDMTKLRDEYLQKYKDMQEDMAGIGLEGMEKIDADKKMLKEKTDAYEHSIKVIKELKDDDLKDTQEYYQKLADTTQSYLESLAEERVKTGDVSGQIKQVIEERKKELDEYKKHLAEKKAGAKETKHIETEEEKATKLRKQIMENYFDAERQARAQKETDIKAGLSLEQAEANMTDSLRQSAQNAHTEMVALGEKFGGVIKDTKDWQQNMDELGGAVERLKKKEPEHSLLARFLGDKSENEQMTQNAIKIFEGTVQAFTMVADAVMQANEARMQTQMDDIDKRLDEQLGRIDDMRQKALEEAGFAEAVTEENLDAQIAAAEAADDQVLAYKLKRRKEELAINKKYDDMEKEAKKQAEKEKADLEYKAALSKWKMDIAMATVNAAQAVLSALATVPFVPLGVIAAATAATLGGIQVGVVAANPPKPPAFAEGGIVPGSSFSGDQVLARVNSGEGVFTKDQMAALAPAGAGGTQEITITVPVVLDGEVVARVVATALNAAGALLEKRAVAGLAA